MKAKQKKQLKAVLKWLSGKKSVIATIIMGFIAYFAAKGIFGESEVALLTILCSAMFGSVSYVTGKIVYRK